MLLIWLAERDSVRATEDRVVSGAHVVAANTRLLVESTLDRLSRMDESLGADPKQFRPRGLQSGFLFMGLYDATGRAINADGGRGANVASNADFQALAHGKPWAITPFIGAQALHLFGIGRRIERNGQFAGVLTGYISADTLSDTWNAVALGPDSTVTLFREDGQLITRFPVPEK